MVYCKKCARLLDEDVRFCPYCDSEDEHFMQGMTEATDETNVLLRQLDEQIARNENRSDIPQPGINQPDINQPDINQPDINQPDINQSDINQPDINQSDINQPGTNQPNINQSDINQPSIAVDATHAAESAMYTTKAASNIAEPTLAAAESTPYTVEPAFSTVEPAPSTGQYVGMILLSVFLTLPGLIVGIVYMTNKSPAYRKMGLTMLLVSIGATLLWCVACCALFYVIGRAMTTVTTF